MNNNQQQSQQTSSQKPQNTPSVAGLGWKKLGGIILLVLIVIVLARMDRGEKAPVEEVPAVVAGCEENARFNILTGEPCESYVVPTEEVSANGSVTTPTELSFEDAKEVYASSTIILGDACAVAAKEVTYTAPVRVLVTNEGNADQAIALGDKSVTLRPFRYATVSLKEKGSYSLTCNGNAVVAVTVN